MKALCAKLKSRKRLSTLSTTTLRVETQCLLRACHYLADVEQFSVYRCQCQVPPELVCPEATPAITGAQLLTFILFLIPPEEGSTVVTRCSVSDRLSLGSLKSFQGNTVPGITQKLRGRTGRDEILR